MKISLKFEVQDNIIPKNYRSFLLSFFKLTLSGNCPELYEKYYSEKYSVKNFCFSTYIKNAVFGKEEISFDDDFAITLSVDDSSMEGIDWYNAFLKMKNKPFRLPTKNEMTLKSVKIESHRQIKDDTIIVRMLSPIAVRNVNDGKSRYYSCFDEEFIPELKENTVTLLEKITGIDKEKIPMQIEIIKPKKTVTYAFGSNITANLGIYRINSDPIFLNYLYKLGIGSRRSEGFGMFEIIG